MSNVLGTLFLSFLTAVSVLIVLIQYVPISKIYSYIKHLDLFTFIGGTYAALVIGGQELAFVSILTGLWLTGIVRTLNKLVN